MSEPVIPSAPGWWMRVTAGASPSVHEYVESVWGHGPDLFFTCDAMVPRVQAVEDHVWIGRMMLAPESGTVSRTAGEVGARWSLERWDRWAMGLLGLTGIVRDHGRVKMRDRISLVVAPAVDPDVESLKLDLACALDEIERHNVTSGAPTTRGWITQVRARLNGEPWYPGTQAHPEAEPHDRPTLTIVTHSDDQLRTDWDGEGELVRYPPIESIVEIATLGGDVLQVATEWNCGWRTTVTAPVGCTARTVDASGSTLVDADEDDDS